MIIQKSESIKALATAQLALQKEIKDIYKDSTGYGYKYTSFDKLVQYLRPLLAKHGISFIQMPDGTAGSIGLTTMYMHNSGEWIANTVSSPIAEHKGMNTYQSVGSAITYFRRYSLASFAGIASEEDIDASTEIKRENKGGDEEW